MSGIVSQTAHERAAEEFESAGPLVQKAIREKARLERWARRTGNQVLKRAYREEQQVSRERAASARIRERLAEQLAKLQRLHGAENVLVQVLERYRYELAEAESAHVVLKLRTLARYAPLAEARAWEEEHLPSDWRTYPRSDQCALSFVRAAACSRATTWAAGPTGTLIPFPKGVPLALLDGWAILRAVPRRHLRRLLRVRKQKPGKPVGRPVTMLRRWPPTIRRAADAVTEAVNASNQANRWQLRDDSGDLPSSLPRGMPPPRTFTIYDTISAALVHGTDPASRDRPARSDAERKQDNRRNRRARVEWLFGQACIDCRRCRADGVSRFHIDHLKNDGGGRERPWSERTDGLTAQILKYADEHEGRTPPSFSMRCPACHTRRHRLAAQAARVAAEVALTSRVERCGTAATRCHEGYTNTVTITSVANTGTFDQTSRFQQHFSASAGVF